MILIVIVYFYFNIKIFIYLNLHNKYRIIMNTENIKIKTYESNDEIDVIIINESK